MKLFLPIVMMVVPWLPSTLSQDGSYVTSLTGIPSSEKISTGNNITTERAHVSWARQKKGKIPKNSESDLIKRIRLIPKDRLNRYKLVAARRLQVNLVRCFQSISVNSEKVPVMVRTSAKNAIVATQTGKLTPAIAKNLGAILQKGCQQQRQPAVQLQTILKLILPHISSPLQSTLQNILGFVSTNLDTVNTLLGNALGGVPDLLAGVINSLTSSFGALNAALTGSLSSIGTLLGGILV